MSYSGAGLILLTPDLHVLLIQDAKTRKWGFPKGHREPEDTSDIETATREVLEETGITPAMYTIHEDPFRIIRGSSSYIFRYAVIHPAYKYPGMIQNRHEIGGIQWIHLFNLLSIEDKEGTFGNKYLRSWISDVKSVPTRKSIRIFHELCMKMVQNHSNVQAVTPSHSH